MDSVFKAITDPSRRRLLDSLFHEDAQSLSRLTEQLPEMTRYGVMSHLRVLEDAGLITTRRVGRTKLHYLNPVPIRLIHDRWISKYAEIRVGSLARLTSALEGGAAVATPVHVYKTFIKAPPADVWHAITDGDETVKYFYGTRVESSWLPGSEVVYRYEDGTVAADGEVIAADPPHRLEMTFHARWDDQLEAEGPAREVWQLTEANGLTELTIELYDVGAPSKTLDEFSRGFPFIASGLKTLVETGTEMTAG